MTLRLWAVSRAGKGTRLEQELVNTDETENVTGRAVPRLARRNDPS